MGSEMDQISRPLLFLLIAVVGFAGAWMTVLRPQAAATGQEAAVPVTAPNQAAAATGPGGAVEAAQGAAAASDASAVAKQEAAANAGQAPAAAPAKAAAPKAPAAKAKPATATSKPAADPKVTVLLFAGTGADDTVARDVVRTARRPGVRVIVASLRDVASYDKLLGGIEVSASPTILVIGKDRQAQRIEGLPDAAQVEQALRAVR